MYRQLAVCCFPTLLKKQKKKKKYSPASSLYTKVFRVAEEPPGIIGPIFLFFFLSRLSKTFNNNGTQPPNNGGLYGRRRSKYTSSVRHPFNNHFLLVFLLFHSGDCRMARRGRYKLTAICHGEKWGKEEEKE